MLTTELYAVPGLNAQRTQNSNFSTGPLIGQRPPLKTPRPPPGFSPDQCRWTGPEYAHLRESRALRNADKKRPADDPFMEIMKTESRRQSGIYGSNCPAAVATSSLANESRCSMSKGKIQRSGRGIPLQRSFGLARIHYNERAKNKSQSSVTKRYKSKKWSKNKKEKKRRKKKKKGKKTVRTDPGKVTCEVRGQIG